MTHINRIYIIMKRLIIVESYTKTKTIKNYLKDPDTIVTYSSGHIYNLPKEKLGFDIDTWKIEYIKSNPKVIKNIRDLVKKSDVIYLAADPDLEGEAIANNLMTCIKDLLKNKTCHRVTFNEITENAVKNALSNPRNIDINTVNAQETRRIVDRLIGYKVSPILWNKFNLNNLSAGRVQIPALIMCINKQKRIFEKEINPYWTIECKFIFDKNSKKDNIIGTLNIENEINVLKIKDIDIVKQILNKLKTNTEYLNCYDKNIRKISPQPPYTTTTMQQDCYNKYKLNAKNTMKIAQDLYENGLITYLRTDSTNICEEAKTKILNYIKVTYDDKYAKYRTYKTNVKNAQEAHEAIRITNPSIIYCSFDKCTSNHIKVYDLIRNRTLASLMIDCEYTDIKMIFNTKKKCEYSEYTFSSTKTFMTFDGFNKIYNCNIESYDNLIEILETANCYSYEYSSNGIIENIPSMYNEIQLIKELEKEGIGRPSTYSSIIDKLLDKKYVILGENPKTTYEIYSFIKKYNCDNVIVKKNNINIGGTKKDLLIPTEIGIDIINYISDVMPYLCDIKFTSNMENDLDDIIHSKINKKQILDNLYSKIITSISHIIPLQAENKKEYTSGLIKTQYGNCYYNKENNTYTNIESFLKWRKKTIDTISNTEISFIKSLPKKILYLEENYYLHLGKYGLYLKDDNNNNHKLDKKKWISYIK